MRSTRALALGESGPCREMASVMRYANRHRLSVRADGLVGEGERIGHRTLDEDEGVHQLGEATLHRHEPGPGVMRDQRAQRLVPAKLAEVETAVERVEAGAFELGGIADVMQPGGRDEQRSVTGGDGDRHFCGPARHALGVQPALGHSLAQDVPGPDPRPGHQGVLRDIRRCRPPGWRSFVLGHAGLPRVLRCGVLRSIGTPGQQQVNGNELRPALTSLPDGAGSSARRIPISRHTRVR